MRPRTLAYLIPATAVAATAALGVWCFAEALEGHGRNFPGFLLYSNGAVTSLMRKEWEAPRAGVLPRDVVREIDGHPVHSGREAREILDTYPQGERVEFAFERPGVPGLHRVTIQLGRLGVADFGLVFVMPFAIGTLYLLLGAIVFFVKRT